MKMPKDMKEAKSFCRSLCKRNGVKITYDDKWDNFNHAYNQCACAGDSIDCARFSPWNYDLLMFAVMHEIGHLKCDDAKSKDFHIFSREVAAWNYAMRLWVDSFRENISIKMARYMLSCLNSYIPDYNDFVGSPTGGVGEPETVFWCPIKTRVIRRCRAKYAH